MILFPLAPIEIDPHVIMPEQRGVNDQFDFKARQLTGKFRRVWPTSANEVFILRKLKHRVDKFAPHKEGGVILSEDAFQNITGRGDK